MSGVWMAVSKSWVEIKWAVFDIRILNSAYFTPSYNLDPHTLLLLTIQ